MLYFSKIKILIISLFSLILIYLTLSNFIKTEDGFFNKKINLGLDLQGGSYLLLEIDNKPVVIQKLQVQFSFQRPPSHIYIYIYIYIYIDIYVVDVVDCCCCWLLLVVVNVTYIYTYTYINNSNIESLVFGGARPSVFQ